MNFFLKHIAGVWVFCNKPFLMLCHILIFWLGNPIPNVGYYFSNIEIFFRHYIFFIQELSQNWCSLFPGGLITPSIGIPTKRMYSVVHYVPNKYPWRSVCQIDLELQLVLWKQLCILLCRIKPATHYASLFANNDKTAFSQKKLSFMKCDEKRSAHYSS